MFDRLFKSILFPVTACLALVLPVHAAAAADSLQPLSATQLHAITVEASARGAASRLEHSTKSLPAWKTLTAESLQRAIAAGQLQDITDTEVQGILINQAMAWNLVHFQNLSDIKRFFQLVQGKNFFHEPPATARNVTGPDVGYYSDASAGPEGGAISALYNCMPAATWSVESSDPVLWLMRRGDNLNDSKTKDFGKCVRQQRDDEMAPSWSDPETQRGAQSARIIEDRISHQLLAHGCDATGPDQCLGLLHALMSLDEHHPALVKIVKKLDRDVEASSPAPLPMPVKQMPVNVNAEQYFALQAELWRRGIVLSAELDQMQRVPQAWTSTQRQRNIDAAITLMLNQRKFDWMFSKFGQHFPRDYPFANPWQHLSNDGKPAPDVAARLAELGNASAATKGCAIATLQSSGQPPEFWLAYGLKKLHDEQQSCNALPLAWIAARYLAASQAQQPEMLAPIAELKTWVANNATLKVGESIDSALGRNCPEAGYGADYWGSCARNIVRLAAARAQEVAEKLAQEKAEHAAKNDPCQNGVSADLLTYFDYTDDKGSPIGPATISACKPLPGSDGVAVIAVYRKQSQPGAKDAQDSDGDYDLHLMLANKAGELLAQGHFKNAATSDAVSLDEIKIDPHRYALNADTSAFGVITVNEAHCYQCNYSESALSLFVRKGDVLRAVLQGFPVGSTQSSDESDTTTGCAGAYDTATSSIATTATTHHGFADLLVTGDIRHDPGYVRESEKQCVQAPKAQAPSSTEVWAYDGKVYQPVKPSKH